MFGTSLSQAQVDVMEAILDQAGSLPRAQVAYILATAYHETGGKMRPNRENLTYTSAARLRKVWPSRFKSDAAAAPFVRNPVALANHVYNGRLGNRPGTDDGWTYRGGGLSHLTGRDNYHRASAITGVDLVSHPERILEPRIAVNELVQGMVTGRYRGHKLADFMRGDGFDHEGARAIINADVAANGKLIAKHARAFEAALAEAGMPVTAAQRPTQPPPAPRPPAASPVETAPPTDKKQGSGAVSGGIAALILATGAAVAAKWTEITQWAAGWWPF